jgi:glycosyltransferase 2 family protein
MKIKPASILKVLLLLAVAGGLLYFSFKGMSFSKIVQQLREANIFWVSLSLIISVGAFISRAYRWKLLIEPLGYNPSLKKTFYAVMVGYFANYALPRLGEVTRCGSLNKTESVPFTSLIGTVIIERAVDVLTLLACMVLTAIIEFNRLGTFLSEKIFTPMRAKLENAATSPLFIIAVLALMGLLVFGVFYFRKKKRQSSKGSKVSHFVNELLKGLKSIANLKRPGQFIFHSILIWIFYFLSTYLAFFALPNTHLSMGAALFLLVLGSIAMSAPVQGGIGVYHLLVSEGLMLYGLSRENGLAFAILVHGSQMVLTILLGAACFLLLFLENKNKSQQAREVG